MKAKKIIIKGKVHDVGYRLFLLTEAESMFIENFDARNIVVNGEQHLIVKVGGPEEKINRFVEFAHSNYPPEASVLAVDVEDYPEEIRSIDSFRQSFMVSQLAKIAQVGAGMLRKQDTSLEKQDMMLDRQDMMLDRQDMMLEKQDETITAIREESEKTREVIKGKIEEDVEWLKAEIIEIKTTLGKVKERVGMV